MSDDEIPIDDCQNERISEEPSKVRQLRVVPKSVKVTNGAKMILLEAIAVLEKNPPQAMIVLRIEEGGAIRMTWSAGANTMELLGALQMATKALDVHKA
jgi:hypothetical protein